MTEGHREIPPPAAGAGRPVPVRPATEADLAAVARLHVERISEGFLAQLGPDFLTRLYRRILRTPDSFVLVAADGDRVVGFVSGSGNVSGLYRRFLLIDGIGAALGALGTLAGSWRRVLETVGHGSDGPGRGLGPELLAIAVAGDAAGGGVGTALVNSFLGEAVRLGYAAAYVVVAAHNDAAIALYGRRGFSTVEQFELHPGVGSLLMQWNRVTSAAEPHRD